MSILKKITIVLLLWNTFFFKDFKFHRKGRPQSNSAWQIKMELNNAMCLKRKIYTAQKPQEFFACDIQPRKFHIFVAIVNIKQNIIVIEEIKYILTQYKIFIKINHKFKSI